jgi:hypothetical protein
LFAKGAKDCLYRIKNIRKKWNTLSLL